MTNQICIFEDQYYRRLLPLVYTRPVYDLRCGILTLREKIQRQYSSTKTSLHVRAYLADSLRQSNGSVSVNALDEGGCLFLNGRLIAGRELSKQIPASGEEAIYVQGDVLIAARLRSNSRKVFDGKFPEALKPSLFPGLPRTEVETKLINYPWDLIGKNGQEIVSDFAVLSATAQPRIKGVVYEGAHLVNKENIIVGDGSKIKPGVVLDAENGPIYIGNNVTVFPNAVIEGPAFVGDRTLIKAGAKIYENTSIGEVCKVGGEVEASIIHSYSNKQHDGFLGHAYLGQWVNLGADTNNSDLKNNYGTVKVVIDGVAVDSGSMFMGLVMGDHSKSSINSMFNTGTVVGVSSNVFGSGFPPKYVPSFSWGGSDNLTTYDPERALLVASRVMGRRKIELSEVDRTMLKAVFEMTRTERTSLHGNSEKEN